MLSPENLSVAGLSANLTSSDAAHFARMFVAPAILALILIVHSLYFRANRKRCGQQQITLEDLTDLPQSIGAANGGLTIVHGRHVEFDAAARTSRPKFLAAPLVELAPTRRGAQRLTGRQVIQDETVKQTIICSDDLVVDGRTLFQQPVKVAGDLIVNGQAVFLRPVIVNGVLKINGSAHFAGGIVAKRDALVRGSMAIGGDGQPAWAVVRELALINRLALHGTLVTARAVEMKEAA